MSKAFLKAAAAGQNARLEALLADGVGIDFADKMPGRTALIEAAIAGHADTVRWLIERGANLDLTDRSLGYTALGWAAYQGDQDIVHRLLSAGARVDLTASKFQLSPLMAAAQAGQGEVVTTLLAAGADPHLQTGDGRNALAMAEANHHGEVAELLRRHGAQLPTPPQETFLPWPALAADLSNVNDADPASVLRGFILAMHRWEKDCGQHAEAAGTGNLDWPRVQQEQDRIFERFCTPKARPYGRCGSFRSPPEYAPEEALVSIDIQGSRAALWTRQGSDRVMRYETVYVLARKSDGWRVDNKKTRPWGTEDWTKGIL